MEVRGVSFEEECVLGLDHDIAHGDDEDDEGISDLGVLLLSLALMLRSFGMVALLSARKKCSSTAVLMSP